VCRACDGFTLRLCAIRRNTRRSCTTGSSPIRVLPFRWARATNWAAARRLPLTTTARRSTAVSTDGVALALLHTLRPRVSANPAGELVWHGPASKLRRARPCCKGHGVLEAVPPGGVVPQGTRTPLPRASGLTRLSLLPVAEEGAAEFGEPVWGFGEDGDDGVAVARLEGYESVASLFEPAVDAGGGVDCVHGAVGDERRDKCPDVVLRDGDAPDPHRPGESLALAGRFETGATGLEPATSGVTGRAAHHDGRQRTVTNARSQAA
jgi:hypothetical protein